MVTVAPDRIVELDWASLTNEAYREYVYPDGGIYRIDNPVALAIKPGSNGHRVVSEGLESDRRVSHYVEGGWLAIRWEGNDGTDAYDW